MSRLRLMQITSLSPEHSSRRPRDRRFEARNYLARLAAQATTIINVTEYAKTVRDL
jgi:replicative DNA helicase